MNQRAIVATELQSILEDLQRRIVAAERLAAASGGMVDPRHFRAMLTSVTLAAGNLDQKGLLDQRPVTDEPAAESAP